MSLSIIQGEGGGGIFQLVRILQSEEHLSSLATYLEHHRIRGLVLAPIDECAIDIATAIVHETHLNQIRIKEEGKEQPLEFESPSFQFDLPPDEAVKIFKSLTDTKFHRIKSQVGLLALIFTGSIELYASQHPESTNLPQLFDSQVRKRTYNSFYSVFSSESSTELINQTIENQVSKVDRAMERGEGEISISLDDVGISSKPNSLSQMMNQMMNQKGNGLEKEKGKETRVEDGDGNDRDEASNRITTVHPTSSTPPVNASSSSQPIQSSTGYFKPPPVQFNYDSAKAAAAGVSHYSNQSQGRNHHLGDQRTQFIPNHSIEISQPIQLQVPIWEGYNLVKALKDERDSHDPSSNDPLPRTNSYWGSDNWLLHHDAIKADFNNGIKFPYHKFTQSKKDAFVEEVNERVNFYMPVVSGVPYRPGQLGLSVAASNQLMGLDGSCPKPDFDYTQDYSTRSSALVKLSDQPCLMFVGGKEAVKDGESTNDINRFTRSLEAWCQSVKGLSWTILGDKSSNWNPLYKLYTSQEDDNKIASVLLNKLTPSIAASCLAHFSSTSTTSTGSGIMKWLRSNYVSDYATRAKGYNRSFSKLHPSQLGRSAGFKE